MPASRGSGEQQQSSSSRAAAARGAAARGAAARGAAAARAAAARAASRQQPAASSQQPPAACDRSMGAVSKRQRAAGRLRPAAAACADEASAAAAAGCCIQLRSRRLHSCWPAAPSLRTLREPLHATRWAAATTGTMAQQQGRRWRLAARWQASAASEARVRGRSGCTYCCRMGFLSRLGGSGGSVFVSADGSALVAAAPLLLVAAPSTSIETILEADVEPLAPPGPSCSEAAAGADAAARVADSAAVAPASEPPPPAAASSAASAAARADAVLLPPPEAPSAAGVVAPPFLSPELFPPLPALPWDEASVIAEGTGSSELRPGWEPSYGAGRAQARTAREHASCEGQDSFSCVHCRARRGERKGSGGGAICH